MPKSLSILSVDNGKGMSVPPFPHHGHSLTTYSSYEEVSHMLKSPKHRFDLFVSGVIHPQILSVTGKGDGKRIDCDIEIAKRSEQMLQALMIACEISLSGIIPKIILTLPDNANADAVRRIFGVYLTPGPQFGVIIQHKVGELPAVIADLAA